MRSQDRGQEERGKALSSQSQRNRDCEAGGGVPKGTVDKEAQLSEKGNKNSSSGFIVSSSNPMNPLILTKTCRPQIPRAIFISLLPIKMNKNYTFRYKKLTHYFSFKSYIRLIFLILSDTFPVSILRLQNTLYSKRMMFSNSVMLTAFTDIW